jgi:catechol-2,3-dioxygenase
LENKSNKNVGRWAKEKVYADQTGWTRGHQEARLGSGEAVFKVDADAASPQKNQVGLAHIALVADSFATVKAMYQRLKEYNVPIVRTVDHGITKSVYF